LTGRAEPSAPNASAEDARDIDETVASCPAATYGTQEEAARAALDEANPSSIRENVEYGGLVYRDDHTGRYGYTTPSRGSGTGFDPSSVSAPDETSVVGDYHTHGDYSTADGEGNPVRTSDPARDDFNSDQFSRSDLRGIRSDGAGNPDYRGYLGTPGGTYRQYDPSTGTVSDL
jgi:hypothetical protein